MKAMLLAAGTGSRLRPLTDTVPKPLAPIANQPLLERTISWLVDEGVTEIVINLHHHAEQIRNTIGDGDRKGAKIHYSFENALLGTSGAVKAASEHFQEEVFFVVYGDNLIDVRLKPLMQFHKEHNADATIALFVPDDPSASGMVEHDEFGRVTRFVEKPKFGESFATMANAGIYLVHPTMVATIPNGFSDFGVNMFPSWLNDGRRIFATELGGYLQDTGTPDRYRKANWDVLIGLLRYKTVGKLIGETLIAESAKIGGSTQLIGRNIIGQDVEIGAGCILEECIVWDNAKIASGCRLKNVIIGEGSTITLGTTAIDIILA